MAALTTFVLVTAVAASTAADTNPMHQWSVEIAEASARFGVPEQWIRRVIRAESGGRVTQHDRPIVSRSGALGLMQLMPGTWRAMSSLLGLGGDPENPHDNILAGTFYLRLMYDRFGYPGLFAAYNAGPARYAASLNGEHPLPAETRAYVAKLALAGRVAHPIRTRVRNSSMALFAVVHESDAAPARGAARIAAPELLPRSAALFAIAEARGR